MGLEGYVDFEIAKLVGGWAWDSERPDSCVSVDIRVGGKLIASVVAKDYRADLRKRGIGNGCHAYWCALPESTRRGDLSVSIAGAPASLPRSRMIPLPPPDMLFYAVGNQDYAHILATGAEDCDKIIEALSTAGFPLLQQKRRILDWGCGCGRIARHWEQYAPSIELFGCDIFAPSVQWCQDHIPFGTFAASKLHPPLLYPDQYFDLVYGISVLTHLGFESHFLWMRELWRILKPDGAVVLTVHGPSILPIVLNNIRGSTAQNVSVHVIDNELFIYSERGEGSNETGNVLTFGMFERLFHPFNIAFYYPRLGLMGIQDTYVLTKKTTGALRHIPSLLDCEISGERFRIDIAIEISNQRNLAVLAAVSNLTVPAKIRLGVQLPNHDNTRWSQPVAVPDKVQWTQLKEASSFVTIDDIPEWNGPATLSVEVLPERPVDAAHLSLRNCVLF